MNLVATTYSGLEGLLEEELASLGATGLVQGKRMVAFQGDLRLVYRVNYASRLALRVLMGLHDYTFRSRQEYYDGMRNMAWEDHFGPDQTIAVQAVTFGELMPHSKYAAQVAKDAIVDRFRERSGSRPNVDLERPDIRVHVHVGGDQCHVSLDSSGEPLYKRGWRRESGEAPLSEVMAAALVKLSGWDGEGELLDPMCGSATIPIEAALALLNIPAGFYRRFFGFYTWPSFDQSLWKQVKAEADAGMLQRTLQIRASDAAWRAADAARANVASARLEHVISVDKKPFQAIYPRKARGVLITNPPYGGRIRPRDNMALYREFGDYLKQRFTDHTAWIFSGDLQALKNIGLKPARKYVLFNGPIECRLAGFRLFEGKLEEQG